MKVKLKVTLDVDIDEYWNRFIDPDEPDNRPRSVIVRDDVKGLAAAAAIGWFDEVAPGVIKNYDVDVWNHDEAHP